MCADGQRSLIDDEITVIIASWESSLIETNASHTRKDLPGISNKTPESCPSELGMLLANNPINVIRVNKKEANKGK